jgi:integrase/recombinase XerD
MDVVVVITQFKQTLTARGYSPATVAHYRHYLSSFNRWLQDNGITDLKQVTAKVLADYQGYVKQKPIAAETAALYIRPVKRLFEYLVEAGRLLIDPAEGIVETCRKNRKLAPVLGEDQVRRLLQQPNLSTTAGLRDRAVLEVLYATAVRRNELLNLSVYDADLKDNVLYIRKAKGRVQRVVPLTKTAAAYVKEYLARIRPRWAQKMPKERRLFLINTGKPLNAGALQALIRKYRLSAKIKTPVSAHTFRRSCATHMLRSGADIRYIQALLGHRSLRTTQRYAQVAAADIKQTHQKSHPGKSL